MKKLFKKTVSIVLATSLVVGLCLFGAGKKSYAEQNVSYKYSYENTDPLFAATHFHLFAQERIDSSSHTHGNVACAVYSGNPDFGTRPTFYENNKSEEITYIRTIESINPNMEAGTLVLGSQYSILSPENAGQTRVGDGEVEFTFNHIGYNNILIESEGTDLIDLDAEFVKLRNLSSIWSQTEETGNVVFDFADENRLTIDCSNVDMSDGIVYGAMPASILTKDRPITITGLDKEGTGIVVINVDLCDTPDDFVINTTQWKVYYTDGTQASNDEVGPEKYGEDRIVFNFFDSSKSNYNYQGNIDFSSGTPFMTVLAPSADLTIGAINGTAIAKNITHVGSESHRKDIVKGSGKIVEVVIEEGTTEATTAYAEPTTGSEEGTTEATTATTQATVATTEATAATTEATAATTAATTQATAATTQATAATTQATAATTQVTVATTQATVATTQATAATTQATAATTQATVATTQATVATTQATAATTQATVATTQATAAITEATAATTQATATTTQATAATTQATAATTQATAATTQATAATTQTTVATTQTVTRTQATTTTQTAVTTQAAATTQVVTTAQVTTATTQVVTTAVATQATAQNVTSSTSENTTTVKSDETDATSNITDTQENEEPSASDVSEISTNSEDSTEAVDGNVDSTSSLDTVVGEVAADEDQVTAPETGDGVNSVPYLVLILGSMAIAYMTLKKKID